MDDIKEQNTIIKNKKHTSAVVIQKIWRKKRRKSISCKRELTIKVKHIPPHSSFKGRKWEI